MPKYIDLPEKELIKLTKSKSYTEIAEMFGVTSSTVGRRIRKLKEKYNNYNFRKDRYCWRCNKQLTNKNTHTIITSTGKKTMASICKDCDKIRITKSRWEKKSLNEKMERIKKLKKEIKIIISTISNYKEI